VVLVILAVVAAVAAAALAFRPAHHPASHASQSPSASHSTASAAPVVQPLGAQEINEPGTQANAGMAIDGNPHTAWQTQFYKGNPVFGGLKTGSGLILDIGHAVKLSSVKVLFGPTAGASVSIGIGNDGSASQQSNANFTTVSSAANLPGGSHTFRSDSTASGRYVLIWFTRLPPEAGGPANDYEAAIFNVVVRGSS
jgi:hypothetical protein